MQDAVTSPALWLPIALSAVAVTALRGLIYAGLPAGAFG
jgi:hypothetical protein